MLQNVTLTTDTSIELQLKQISQNIYKKVAYFEPGSYLGWMNECWK